MWRHGLRGRDAQLTSNCLQDLPVLCLHNLLLYAFKIMLFFGTLREEFLHFRETMLRLPILLEVGLGIVV